MLALWVAVSPKTQVFNGYVGTGLRASLSVMPGRGLSCHLIRGCFRIIVSTFVQHPMQPTTNSVSVAVYHRS